jgi:hypothetical protein
MPAVKIDRGPDPKQIFRGEDRGGGALGGQEEHLIAGADRLDRFKDHGSDVQDDQERQQQVEQPHDPVARRVVVEQMTEAATP